MDELVSYVCVRAGHQWATADAGQVNSLKDGLAYRADAALDAYLGSVESAAS